MPRRLRQESEAAAVDTEGKELQGITERDGRAALAHAEAEERVAVVDAKEVKPLEGRELLSKPARRDWARL